MPKMTETEFKNHTAYCPPVDNCVPQETIIRNVRLAAAYVPYQKMCTLFSPIDALKHGTSFPELYSPYDKGDNERHMEIKE